MKWFKHDTNALHDAKIEKLIMKYGIEGYGLYFACVEIIAGSLNNDNITFELEHDAEILAYKFKLDQLKTEEMMKYIVKLKLFENIGGKVYCHKLASRIDSSLIKNPALLEIKKSIKEDSRLIEKDQDNSSQTRLDKNRTEENKEEKNKETLSLLTHWNNIKTLPTHKESTILLQLGKKRLNKYINDCITEYGFDSICKAFDNFAEVLDNKEYFWSYSWSFIPFMERGLDQFVDEACPFEKFKTTSFDKPETENSAQKILRLQRAEHRKTHRSQDGI